MAYNHACAHSCSIFGAWLFIHIYCTLAFPSLPLLTKPASCPSAARRVIIIIVGGTTRHNLSKALVLSGNHLVVGQLCDGYFLGAKPGRGARASDPSGHACNKPVTQKTSCPPSLPLPLPLCLTCGSPDKIIPLSSQRKNGRRGTTLPDSPFPYKYPLAELKLKINFDSKKPRQFVLLCTRKHPESLFNFT